MTVKNLESQKLYFYKKKNTLQVFKDNLIMEIPTFLNFVQTFIALIVSFYETVTYNWRRNNFEHRAANDLRMGKPKFKVFALKYVLHMVNLLFFFCITFNP